MLKAPIFHVTLENKLHPAFCEAIQWADLVTCENILKKIPTENRILFLRNQTVGKEELFEWIFKKGRNKLELIMTLVQCMPQGKATAVFLEKQHILYYTALLEIDSCISEKVKKEKAIIAVLEKVPAQNKAQFLHNQPFESEYRKMGFTIWLCEAKYLKVLDSILGSLPAEDLMPFLNTEFYFKDSTTYSIFDWAMAHKESQALTHIIQYIPNSEIVLFKKILDWIIMHPTHDDIEEICLSILKRVPDDYKLDLLKEVLPNVALWKNERTRNNFFDMLKKQGVCQLHTSLEKDNILIILIKSTHHFLSEEEYKCYQSTIKHLFAFYSSVDIANTPRVKVNHQNAKGHTALHYAIEHAKRSDRTELITILLEHGADCSLLDADQQDFIFKQKRNCLFSYVLHKENSYLNKQPASWGVQEAYIVETLLATNISLGNHEKEEMENMKCTLQKTETADWSVYKEEIQRALALSPLKDSKNVYDLISEYAVPNFGSEKGSAKSPRKSPRKGK